MKKQKRSMVVLGIIAGFMAGAIVLPGFIGAGDLNPPAGPDDAGSAMYTLEDIYNRLNDNTTATKLTGTFTEPSAGPGPTGRTLDQVYDKALNTLRSQVEKTGQTTTYSTYDDGYFEKGFAWPGQRFKDNNDGTVTDNLTGLIWLKNANCFGTRSWYIALSDCNGLASGSCGLNDGSGAGEWRLPNRFELESLFDMSQKNPVLPSGYPFTDVQSNNYWSGTTRNSNTDDAWYVGLNWGKVLTEGKSYALFLWPVRGRQ